jgi:hypothetical protein
MQRPLRYRSARHAPSLRSVAGGLYLVALLNAAWGCSGDDALDDDDLGAAGTSAAGALGGSSTDGSGTGGSSTDGPATGGSATGGSATSGSSGSDAGGTNVAGSGGSSAADAGSDSETIGPDPGEGETGIFVGMTAAHNETREALGLPDLTWSPEIAEFSQQWSDSLAENECGTIEHRDQQQYGENIAIRGSTRADDVFTPEQAVAGWVSEVACWEFGTIRGSESCDAACAEDLHSNGCGHYTQVVWRNTQRVGCGYSTCAADGFNYEVWVCNYDPPGNFIGQAPY